MKKIQLFTLATMSTVALPHISFSQNLKLDFNSKNIPSNYIMLSSINTQLRANRSSVISLVAGKVEKILVNQFDSVKKGQDVIVINVMKMPNSLQSMIDGTVLKINVKVGDIVEEGQELMVITNG